MMTQIFAVACVVGIAIGQLLFKSAAMSFQRSGSLFDPRSILIAFGAFVLVGLTTLVWIWLLQKADLGRIYPIQALAFLLVPVGSYIFFGERFHPQYFFGLALIIFGIVLTTRASL